MDAIKRIKINPLDQKSYLSRDIWDLIVSEEYI